MSNTTPNKPVTAAGSHEGSALETDWNDMKDSFIQDDNWTESFFQQESKANVEKVWLGNMTGKQFLWYYFLFAHHIFLIDWNYSNFLFRPQRKQETLRKHLKSPQNKRGGRTRHLTMQMVGVQTTGRLWRTRHKSVPVPTWPPRLTWGTLGREVIAGTLRDGIILIVLKTVNKVMLI